MNLDLSVNAGQDEVTLPAFLAHTDLSLAEIGMIFLIASIPCDQDPTPTLQRMGSPEDGEVIKALKKKGIVNSKLDGTNLSIGVDLDGLLPLGPRCTEAKNGGGEG